MLISQHQKLSITKRQTSFSLSSCVVGDFYLWGKSDIKATRVVSKRWRDSIWNINVETRQPIKNATQQIAFKVEEQNLSSDLSQDYAF